MFRRRIGWLGIDIGSRSVKIAQVERDAADRLSLRQAAIIGRRAPWDDDDRGMAAPAAGSGPELLAAVSYGEEFCGISAACVLPMHLYGFRGLHLPPGSPAERRSMVAAELQDSWDECNAECEIDFWETDIAGTKFRQDEPNVNVLAISKAWSQQVCQDARAAGLRLEVLDGPPLTLARAVGLAVPPQQRSPIAVLDWGFTSTTFCIVQHGRSLFTRRVRSTGLRLVCENIQESLSVSLEEAQHLLIRYGLPAASEEKGDADRRALQQTLAEAAADHLGRLADEIRRTLTYFRAQRRALLPESCCLVGGGACIPQSVEWLSEACDLPVQAWSLALAARNGRSPSLRREQRTGGFPEPLLAKAIALSALPL